MVNSIKRHEIKDMFYLKMSSFLGNGQLQPDQVPVKRIAVKSMTAFNSTPENRVFRGVYLMDII